MLTIETKKLKLRELDTSDEDCLYDILSDKETMQYYPSPYDKNQVRAMMRKTKESYKKNGFGLWGIILKEKNKFIGQCGITKQDINGIIVPEIGYHVNKEFWRKGFATEASAACLKYGFEKLQLIELYIHTYIRNIPSQRVAEKLKMEKVKIFNKYINDYDIYMMHVVYKMNISTYMKLISSFERYLISSF